MSHALTALSPLDGRYASKTRALQDHFSEFALIRLRVRIEIAWLEALAAEPAFDLLPPFSAGTLAELDVLTSLRRIQVPIWFVNGQYDQLRVRERLFTRVARHAELIVVPQTSHLVTAMRPRVFNAVLDLAVATVGALREGPGENEFVA